MTQTTEIAAPFNNAPARPRGAPPTGTVIGAVVLAGSAAVVLARAWTAGTFDPTVFGLPDPGDLTRYGLPIAQFVHELAVIAVVGLLFIRLLAPETSAAAAHLAIMTTRWSWVWAGSTLLWIIFTMSDLIGVPVSALPGRGEMVLIVAGTGRILTEMATLWVALALALFAERFTARIQTGAMMLIALAGLLPNALTGHAGHHASPTLAVFTLAVHIVGAAIWAGALLALVLHLRGFPAELRRALPRFSTVALICVVAIGISGVIESAITLDGWAGLWQTDRGHLILAKSMALVVLAGIGYWHRRRTVHRAIDGRLLPLLRLAGLELALMGATIGIAVALSTTG